MIQKDPGSRHGWSASHRWKRLLKFFDKRKNRNATKQKIHHEDYDDIPHNQKVKEEDSWSWD